MDASTSKLCNVLPCRILLSDKKHDIRLCKRSALKCPGSKRQGSCLFSGISDPYISV